jgi:hypothetical protein
MWTDNAGTAQNRRGASFQRRASKVRGREEVITDMPKKKATKKKATKKKKH